MGFFTYYIVATAFNDSVAIRHIFLDAGTGFSAAVTIAVLEAVGVNDITGISVQCLCESTNLCYFYY